MTTNLFEYAVRNKLRFSSPRGELSAEQLLDVPLRSKDGFDLNAVAVNAKRALTVSTEENFVETTKTVESTRRERAMELVLQVIDEKKEAEAMAKVRAENLVKKSKLLQALAEKQDGKLSKMSENEIKRQLDELDV